jgi:hypothetical protein
LVTIDGVDYDVSLFNEEQSTIYDRINRILLKKNELMDELDNLEILSSVLASRLQVSLHDTGYDYPSDTSADNDADVVYNTAS